MDVHKAVCLRNYNKYCLYGLYTVARTTNFVSDAYKMKGNIEDCLY